MRKHKKTWLCTGKVCTLDPWNTKKQKDFTSVDTVTVLKRVKWRPFGKSIYRCVDNRTDQQFDVAEGLLYPSGMNIIRIPSEWPIFNREDMIAMEIAYTYIRSTGVDDIYCDRLMAIKDKMQLSIDTVEV